MTRHCMPYFPNYYPKIATTFTLTGKHICSTKNLFQVKLKREKKENNMQSTHIMHTHTHTIITSTANHRHRHTSRAQSFTLVSS